MNILITGASGFLGREFAEHYELMGYNVVRASRDVIDFTKEEEVDAYFLENHVDIVLHTAVKGDDTFLAFVDNINMFNNLRKHYRKYRLMISFGSGAEFNRATDITKAREEDIYCSFPSDHYGLAKNLIAREINNHNNNIINLRLFGCFGKYEKTTRFIKNSLRRIREGLPILVDQDRKMDFFYVKDLLKVIDYFIGADVLDVVDLNMCYDKKISLSEIAHDINVLTGAPYDAIIQNKVDALAYTGSSRRLNKLEIEFEGLEAGIKELNKA